MTQDATNTQQPASTAPANGQLKDLLARFQRDLDVQAQALAARESHVRNREGRLVNRRERLAQMAMAIKNQRALVVEMEVTLKRQSNALQFSQDSQVHQTQHAQDLHRQAEQAHEEANAKLAEIDGRKLDLERQAKALEHRQAHLEKQQQQLSTERASLQQLRDQVQSHQAALDAEREAFAREQAQIEKQLTDREAQVGELEAIEQALRKREAAVQAAEESLEETPERVPIESDSTDLSHQLDTRAADLKEREHEVSQQQAKLEHELQLKLEDVQAQQAQLETLQRQWDQRLAELETRETPAPSPDDSALREREQAVAEREEAFRKKRDKTLHDFLIKREQLAKEQRRNDRLRDRLENRRARIRRSKKHLQQRWQIFNEQTVTHEDAPSRAIDDSSDVSPTPEALPSLPRLVWLSPVVFAAMVVGVLAIVAACFFIAPVLHPPLYVANARLSLALRASMTPANSPLVTDIVLAGAMDRLASRNLQPFPDAAAMQASLADGPATFMRIGENRYELAFIHANPELAVLIVEAWSEALITHLRAPAQAESARAVTPSFISRPAYDPAPLAASQQQRWEMFAIMLGVAAPLYLLLITFTARRHARLRYIMSHPLSS